LNSYFFFPFAPLIFVFFFFRPSLDKKEYNEAHHHQAAHHAALHSQVSV
jgi:hypothetical protein